MPQAQTVLIKLRELQDADLELRALEMKKAAHDRAAIVRAAQIETHRQTIKALRTEHKVARAGTDGKELEVREKRAHIDKLRGQQMQVKDNRQFQALQNEIRFAELAISKLEDDILSDLGDLEGIEAKVKAAEDQLAGHERDLKELRKEIEGRKSEVDTEIQACRDRRQQIASGLPAKVVEQFDRIADRLDGEALAPVLRDEDGGSFMCGGCNMSVTQNTYVLLRGHSDDLVTCPNCTRILYLEAKDG